MEKIEKLELFDANQEKSCIVCGRLFSGEQKTMCDACATLLERVRNLKELPSRERRLTKAQKRSLWKKKSKKCEICGVENVGGPHYAIHPFRPADWDGTLNTVRVLCATCLGQESSKRAKIFESLKDDTN